MTGVLTRRENLDTGYAEGRPCEDTKGSQLQAKERDIRRNQLGQNLDLGLLASGTGGKKFLLFSPSSLFPSKLIQCLLSLKEGEGKK